MILFTKNSVPINGLIGAIIVFRFMDLLWMMFEGGHIPVFAFGLCFIVLSLHYYYLINQLNYHAKMMTAVERWAIVIACLYNVFVFESIRWI